MNRNNQGKVQTEDAYQTLSEFLENTPPNQWRNISDLSAPEMRYTGPHPTVSAGLNTPDLELHCSNDLCHGVRFFRCIKVFSSTGTYIEENALKEDNVNYLCAIYQCSNCQKTQKVYSLAAALSAIE